jgi:hypothetical protein
MSGWLHGRRFLARRRFRSRVAALCLAAWGIAFVVVPGGHLLHHRHDHHHRVDPHALWVRHGEGAHAPERRHAHAHDAKPDVGHGHGDPAHLAAALLAPAAAWPPLCAELVPDARVAATPESPHLAPRAGSVSARGPPARSA